MKNSDVRLGRYQFVSKVAVLSLWTENLLQLTPFTMIVCATCCELH